MLADSASVARFNREAANASQIEHEGVARVFDFGETAGGMVYLAMEYVPGRSLRDVLDQDGALDLAKTASLVRQVADGLDAAHRLGIVHRDLKPDNILVAEDEGTHEMRCKVVDFGIAKAVGAPSGQTQLTRTGMVVGTPEFMSPEQLLSEDLDQRSDVYALALVAYQCLTLDLPFDTRSPDRGMTARLVSQPRGLAAVRPDLPWPLALQRAFDEALTSDRDARTPSAGDFADAFEAAAAEAGVVVGRRNTRMTPMASVPISATPLSNTPLSTTPLSATPVASATVGGRQAAAGAGATAPAAAPAAKKGSGGLIGIAAAVLVLGGGGAWYATRGDSAAAPPAADSTGAAGPTTAGADAPPATPSTPAGGANGGAQSGGAGGAPISASGAGARGTAANGTTSAPAGAPAGAPGGGSTPAPSAVSPARASLDSISRELDPSMGDPSAATVTAALSALRALMPKLTTADDSTWAYIRVLEAHLLRDDERSACSALQAASRMARTMRQAEIVRGYEGSLSCK